MRATVLLRSPVSIATVLAMITGCRAHDADPGRAIDAAPPVPCAVASGACATGQLCVHVCDCCGIPSDGGVETEPRGHDTCVDDTGQCDENLFFLEGRACQCFGNPGEAQCPCA